MQHHRNTFFAHMSSQPSSVNLETLGNMHQCQQTSLGNYTVLLPSALTIYHTMPCNSLSQCGKCISLDLPAIGPILYSLS